MGSEKTFVLGAIALEKISDMTMYALLFLLLVRSMLVLAWLSQPIYSFAIFTFSMLLITLVITYLFKMEFVYLWLDKKLIYQST